VRRVCEVANIAGLIGISTIAAPVAKLRMVGIDPPSDVSWCRGRDRRAARRPRCARRARCVTGRRAGDGLVVHLARRRALVQYQRYGGDRDVSTATSAILAPEHVSIVSIASWHRKTAVAEDERRRMLSGAPCHQPSKCRMTNSVTATTTPRSHRPTRAGSDRARLEFMAATSPDGP